MNANSELKASITAKTWLTTAQEQLKQAGIPSARLDAELLLLHVLNKQKTWLITHIEHKMNSEQTEVLRHFLQRRLKREPLAYITNQKEFYGRMFFVNQDVLIPRPETESLIDMTKKLQPKPGEILIDVGTGSGCVGLTIKAELPELNVWLSDISERALIVTKHNARKLTLRGLQYYQSDLLMAWLPVPAKPYVQYILANLPYVDPSWQTSPETAHEPPLALFADESGLQLIKKLIAQAEQLIVPHGHLLLEADTRQLDAIVAFAKLHSFIEIERQGFCICLQKRTNS